MKFNHSFLSVLVALVIFCGTIIAREHPSIAISKAEAQQIKAAMGKYPLLDKTIANYRETVEHALNNPIELPVPGEAGGYSHERHKQNYREMHRAGLLFAITGEEKYARFIKKMLDGYAEMYPKLGPHPRSFKQKPGKLFHQTLNEEVWLTHVAIAYDCVYDWLKPADRDTYEANIFLKMMELFAVEHHEEFDRIHNHGTWAVAAVGMMAYVLDQPEWIEKCLYGTKKDGKGGFLKQMDLLFSPDGYYMEGPYYSRYAVRPFFLFADAIERIEPQRNIYEHRDAILKKAYYSLAETIFPNGVFPPINDASKTMSIADIGPVVANDLTFYRYGADDNLLAIAAIQDQVMLNGAGLAVAKAFGDGSNVPDLNWKSVEFTDGFDGERGGLGILRNGSGPDQTMLLMKYGVQGDGHGHFDKLQFIFYDQHREVVPDYGFSRWINMEPKYGGRYTKENDSFAKQTIAHNTVVVDEKTQHNFSRSEADDRWAERHFFDGNNGNVQAMSARANSQYAGVTMQRTQLLLKDDQLDFPMVIDLFRLTSDTPHQYDYPVYFNGQMVVTNVPLNTNLTQLQPMGDDAGYQHIWKIAEGIVNEPLQFTWVDGQRYYSLVSANSPEMKFILGRTGANDPDFNLRSEQVVILRGNATDQLFASAIVPHGYFNEAAEISRDARSPIVSVSVIGHNETASVIEIAAKTGRRWQVMVNNGAPTDSEISVSFDGKNFRWNGNYNVLFLNN